MKRIIKFRGKSLAGDWEFGDLSQWNEEDGRKRTFISLEGLEPVEVKPDTVGQFTGLHDKYGKDIYDGDIVKRKHLGLEKIYECRWVEQFASYDISNNANHHFLHGLDVRKLEVIGNIYENPELLEGGHQ